jgi:hypothetical protein
MALPMPPMPLMAGAPLNPIETLIGSFNTNTYFIGLMMILLNLGGRHLAGGLTPEQDKALQNPWFRRILLFVVVFVATRNIFTAFWMSLGLVLIVGYLTNENSSFYLFGEPRKQDSAAAAAQPLPQGLSSEEQEIYRRLHDKVNRLKESETTAQQQVDPAKVKETFLNNYVNTMRVIQAST